MKLMGVMAFISKFTTVHLPCVCFFSTGPHSIELERPPICSFTILNTTPKSFDQLLLYKLKNYEDKSRHAFTLVKREGMVLPGESESILLTVHDNEVMIQYTILCTQCPFNDFWQFLGDGS